MSSIDYNGIPAHPNRTGDVILLGTETEIEWLVVSR
jgi:hypothetical protein